MNSGPTRNRRIRCVDKDACSFPERSTRPMIVQKVEAKVPTQVKPGHKNPTLPSNPFGGKHCRKQRKCYSFISNQMKEASLRKATSHPKDTRPRASTPTRNRRIACIQVVLVRLDVHSLFDPRTWFQALSARKSLFHCVVKMAQESRLGCQDRPTEWRGYDWILAVSAERDATFAGRSREPHGRFPNSLPQ